MKTITLFLNDFTSVRSQSRTSLKSLIQKINFRKFGNKFNNNTFFFAAVALVFLIGVYVVYGKLSNESTRTSAGANDDRLAPPIAIASQDLNKTLSIPIKDSKGGVVTNVKYKITSAQLYNEIILRGEKAYPIKGKLFLIVNLEITNEYKQAIDLNATDYLRLSVNGDISKKFSPDIYNELQLQPISTKRSRVGFQINDTDNKLILHVGQVEGTKEPISLHLQ